MDGMKTPSTSSWAMLRCLVLLLLVSGTSACVTRRPISAHPPAHLAPGVPAMFVEWKFVNGRWTAAQQPLGVGLAATDGDPQELVELWLMQRLIEPALLSLEEVVMLGPREELQQGLQPGLGVLGTARVFQPGEDVVWPVALREPAGSNGSVHPPLFHGKDVRLAETAYPGGGVVATFAAWTPGSTEIDVGTLRVTVPDEREPHPSGNAIAYVHISPLGDGKDRLEVWVLGSSYTKNPPPGTEAQPSRVVLGPLLQEEADDLHSGSQDPTPEEFEAKARAWLGEKEITTVLVVVRSA